MRLFTTARSSASFRVRIALALKGCPYDASYVSLARGEHRRAEYTEVNTQGLVPTLVDADRVLTQSLAIIEYLEEKYPDPPLLPRDLGERAYVRALANLVACEMQPLNNLRTLNFLRGECALGEPAVMNWYRHWIAEGFGMLERYLANERRCGRYCLGDSVTIADCCLVPQVFNARRYECDLTPFPTAMRIFDGCMALDAFQRAQPSAQPDCT
jgi:maleylpyruvate isomerase